MSVSEFMRHMRELDKAFNQGYDLGYTEGLTAQAAADDPITEMLRRVNSGKIDLDDAIEELLEG